MGEGVVNPGTKLQGECPEGEGVKTYFIFIQNLSSDFCEFLSFLPFKKQIIYHSDCSKYENTQKQIFDNIRYITSLRNIACYQLQHVPVESFRLLIQH